MSDNKGKEIGQKLKDHFETLYKRVKALENLVDQLIIFNVLVTVAVVVLALRTFL